LKVIQRDVKFQKSHPEISSMVQIRLKLPAY
jgi:hypothetical protein